MVLGIGLNVNNRMTDAPQDLQSQAIALIDISQRPLPLIDVVIDLLKQVAIQLHTLATDRDGLLNRWSEFDVLRNRRIWLKTCSGEACGISRGIDTDGALLLQTDDGIERFLSATVVKWV
jgi:BirA family biotin operon repressor/biotin-[acetyl-CoA-carboxylase] ligase